MKYEISDVKVGDYFLWVSKYDFTCAWRDGYQIKSINGLIASVTYSERKWPMDIRLAEGFRHLLTNDYESISIQKSIDYYESHGRRILWVKEEDYEKKMLALQIQYS